MSRIYSTYSNKVYIKLLRGLIVMDVLSVQFRVLGYFGLWYEKPEKYYLLKMIYRFFVFVLVLQFTVLQFLNLINAPDLDVATLSDILFLLILYVQDYFKLIMFVLKRNEILNLLKSLKICCNDNNDDSRVKLILQKYGQMAKNVYLIRFIISTMSCTLFAVVPILETGKAILPISYSFFAIGDNKLKFVIAYALQMSAVYVTATTEVFVDSTACAFVVLLSAQVEIFRHRFVNAIVTYDERTVIKNLIRHHVMLRENIKLVRSAFMPIILPAIGFGLVTLCTSLFKLATVR